MKWNNFVDISKEMTSSLSWLCETYCHAGVEDAKGKVLAALEKLIEHGKADDISADAEQLKLHAAALPDSDPLRAQLLASADSATTFVQSGLALGWLYLCNLQVSSKQSKSHQISSFLSHSLTQVPTQRNKQQTYC